jgi:hypothetical protein
MSDPSATFRSTSSESLLSFYVFIGILVTVVGAAIGFIHRSESRDTTARHATKPNLDLVLARGWSAMPNQAPHPSMLVVVRDIPGMRYEPDASMSVWLVPHDGTAARIKRGDCTYQDNSLTVPTTTELGPACQSTTVGPTEVKLRIDIALPQDRTLEVSCEGPAHPANRRPEAACYAMLDSLVYN